MDAQDFMDITTMPGHLHIIPYIGALGEYAAVVRAEMLRRRETDFIVAVDLPAGLEEAVLAAVKDLPLPSIIAMPDRRAVPVLPSSAPIEAVRSYLDCGLDLAFVDTPLPVLGSVEDYLLFDSVCREIGCTNTYARLKELEYSLPVGDVVKPGETSPGELFEPFKHVVPAIERRVVTSGSYDALPISMKTRVQFMAYRLRQVLEREIDVVFVCSAPLVAGVVACVGRELPSFPDDFRVPTMTFHLAAVEIPAVTDELPYCSWLYEMNRNRAVDRHAWIRQIYREASEGLEVTPRDVIQAARYAGRLALTDGQSAAGLQDLVTAASGVVDPAYANAVRAKALSYPPAGETAQNGLPPLRHVQTGEPLGTPPEPPASPGAQDNEKKLAAMAERERWVAFTRAPTSVEDEIALMHHLASRFTARRPSATETETREFTCGFREGLDLREMLRDGTGSTIFVREAVMEQAAAYVLDLRTTSLARAAELARPGETTDESWDRYARQFNMRRNFPVFGVALVEAHRLTPAVLTVLPQLTRSYHELTSEISTIDPLSSVIAIALDQSPYVFVFTDCPDEVDCDARDRERLRVLPIVSISGDQRQLMESIKLIGWGKGLHAE